MWQSSLELLSTEEMAPQIKFHSSHVLSWSIKDAQITAHKTICMIKKWAVSEMWFFLWRGWTDLLYTGTFCCFYLVWVQSKVWIQELPSVIVRVSFIDLIRRVPDLNIHGSVCHSVVLEALRTADRQTFTTWLTIQLIHFDPYFKKKQTNKETDHELLLGETLESNNSQWLQEYRNLTQKPATYNPHIQDNTY